MSFTHPKFGIVSPDRETPANKLGDEFKEFGATVTKALSEFDYNGKDPNLVLSQVLALNNQVEELMLKTRETPVVELRTLMNLGVAWSAPANYPGSLQRIGNRVYASGILNNSGVYSSWTAMGVMPLGWRPARDLYASVSPGASPSFKAITINATTGNTLVYSSAATVWAFDCMSWKTDDPWPEVTA